MPQIEPVTIAGERFYQLTDSDAMRPFFMSIVSDANHWLFVASNGGLTAGRKNAEHALFPYYTEDKITESAEVTGSKTIIRAGKNGDTWEPFSIRNRDRYTIRRNLYKSVYGNKVVFEEINESLGLTFSYRWSSSNKYGFVRDAKLTNSGKTSVAISMLDGIQNIVPAGIPSATQNFYSNLVDAYKRNELDPKTGLGIFALSAILVDRAEPSEALKANVVWAAGIEPDAYLVSPLQINAFRHGQPIKAETDKKGEKGAFLIQKDLELAAGTSTEWAVVANVNQNHAGVGRLRQALGDRDSLMADVRADIDSGTEKLIALSAAADGLQRTADDMRDTRHFSNVLFNIMRGGIFDDGYTVEKKDFVDYLAKASKAVSDAHQELVAELPKVFQLWDVRKIASRSADPDFQRLCLEYLPLKFSRRHGDPSRPWNRFSINTNSEVDGSKILDYEGNWRDIFQNWESLAFAYPEWIEGMILKFLNATTFDGYNPYRVTKGGFDWETIEQDDPWSYIGYWGDHQIIYLLKFLEFSEQHQPGKLAEYFDRQFFVYANVPYRIKPYADLLANPKDTIDFDVKADEAIREERNQSGADGALLRDGSDSIYRVNFIEKILATVLAKVSNYIPEGGIWMNTQRPEWNDANNALVGNGVSMVTLYYLRRFLQFFDELLGDDDKGFAVSKELHTFYLRTAKVLKAHEHLLDGAINDKDRRAVVDGLGEAASDYRLGIYDDAFSGEQERISQSSLHGFLKSALAHLDHCIAANRRNDKLYHGYNLMTPTADGVKIAYLPEMLEGQVAALSTGNLSPTDVLSTLDALRSSALYRADQNTYLLYPNKQLPGFLEKNNLPVAEAKRSKLLQKMMAAGDGRIVEVDVYDQVHFNGNFKNAMDMNAALDSLGGTEYANLAKEERGLLGELFEQVFNHKEFTGRSGTFFGYEGLGSTYWHMVSKLALAVQECCLQAINDGTDAATVSSLIAHYYEINAGIGVHKSPDLYGAFPTDPYSHTPAGKGAQQPGMTGQVKEDILCRIGELGATVADGTLRFKPSLLRQSEFLPAAKVFDYVDVAGKREQLDLPAGTLCFTYCQVPVVYTREGATGTTHVVFRDGEERVFTTGELDGETSLALFRRSGDIAQIRVVVSPGVAD